MPFQPFLNYVIPPLLHGYYTYVHSYEYIILNLFFFPNPPTVPEIGKDYLFLKQRFVSHQTGENRLGKHKLRNVLCIQN